MSSLLTTIALATIAGLIAAGFRRLRGTTLTTAALWGLTGVFTALAAGAAELLLPESRAGHRDLCWYLASILLVCPGIAVLGARRPNARVWGVFVLLPLVLVLMWPALAATRVWSSGVPLELEEPALIGFALVLVMATGNYIGTRYTLPVLMYAAAEVLLVAPLSATGPPGIPGREVSRALASITLALGTLLALLRSLGRPDERINRFDHLWIDFVDSFGMVWAKRVMDRMNQSARHEMWTKRLDWHGFVPADEAPDSTSPVTESPGSESPTSEASAAEAQDTPPSDETARTEERIEHTLRWLMKRFVNPEWIDARLTPPRSTHPQRPSEPRSK